MKSVPHCAPRQIVRTDENDASEVFFFSCLYRFFVSMTSTRFLQDGGLMQGGWRLLGYGLIKEFA